MVSDIGTPRPCIFNEHLLPLIILLKTLCAHTYTHIHTQTLLEGISLGTIVTFYDVDLVLKAFVITTTVFLALTVYTMQSKYDFSTWGAR